MTWRNWGWQGGFKWFQIAITVFVVGMLLVLFQDDETSGVIRVIVTIVLAATLVLVYVAHAWITITSGEVQLGYFPLYRRTIPISDIQELTLVTVRPVRDFGGFGVRGLAKSRRGLLLGGHPDRGLKFETVDDRRYIVTLHDLQPVIQELARQGCTLSAESGDNAATEV